MTESVEVRARRAWTAVAVFAAACFAGILMLIALAGCASWRQAARTALTVADIACATANAWRPDEEVVHLCGVTEPAREEFLRHLAGTRVGLARVGVERCEGPKP